MPAFRVEILERPGGLHELKKFANIIVQLLHTVIKQLQLLKILLKALAFLLRFFRLRQNLFQLQLRYLHSRLHDLV